MSTVGVGRRLIRSDRVCKGLLRCDWVCTGLLVSAEVSRNLQGPAEVYWGHRGLQLSAGVC